VASRRRTSTRRRQLPRPRPPRGVDDSSNENVGRGARVVEDPDPNSTVPRHPASCPTPGRSVAGSAVRSRTPGPYRIREAWWFEGVDRGG